MIATSFHSCSSRVRVRAASSASRATRRRERAHASNPSPSSPRRISFVCSATRSPAPPLPRPTTPAEPMHDEAARFVDLHTHSTASDGSRPPREVVRAAHDFGLAAIALTDHDTIDGLADARDEATSLGVRVIAGVELSAVEGNAETHLLGLHLSDVDRVAARLRDLRTMRLTRAERIVNRL